MGRADEVSLVSQSQKRKPLPGRKVRSSRATGRTRAGLSREPRDELEELKAQAREREKKLNTLARELAEAREQQTVVKLAAAN
jgi:hypothetical protein